MNLPKLRIYKGHLNAFYDIAADRMAGLTKDEAAEVLRRCEDWPKQAEFQAAIIEHNSEQQDQLQAQAEKLKALTEATDRPLGALEQVCYHFYEREGLGHQLTPDEKSLWKNCSDGIAILSAALRLSSEKEGAM